MVGVLPDSFPKAAPSDQPGDHQRIAGARAATLSHAVHQLRFAVHGATSWKVPASYLESLNTSSVVRKMRTRAPADLTAGGRLQLDGLL